MSEHNGCRGILIGMIAGTLFWVSLFMVYKAYAYEPDVRRCLIHDTIEDC